MNFRTEYRVAESSFKIRHDHPVVLAGSCFTDHIGQRLRQGGFDAGINPFGTLFNPSSIANCVHTLIEGNEFTPDDFFRHNELWHSFSLHSDYSGTMLELLLAKINETIHENRERLRRASCLLITFGTAWVYEHTETAKTVANCHKLPGHFFRKRKLSIEEIVQEYTLLFEALAAYNPALKIVLTLSPVRHLKDGFTENQWSKSTLYMAIRELEQTFAQVIYFPAYEIVMDDLRDYRFFNTDLVHPSENAIHYTWEKFCATFLESDTLQLTTQVSTLFQRMRHRPLHPDTEAHLRFTEETEKEYLRLKKLLPHLELRP